MQLTPALLARARKLRPGDDAPRIILDSRGIHHKTIPSRNFGHAVTNHAEARNVSAAESLYIVERLMELGAIDGKTVVRGQGAVFQAFRGTGEYQGCHTMPCQLILGTQFPHQLRDGDGKRFNSAFLHRTIQLFARCTWTPKIVNGMDQLLDWNPNSDFVKMYLDSVRAVLEGEDPKTAYCEFTWKKAEVLKGLLERVGDEPLTTYDALLLMGALNTDPGTEGAMTRQEIDRLLADKEYLAGLQQQKEIVIEAYAERDQIVPHEVLNGELRDEIRNENWSGKSSSTAG